MFLRSRKCSVWKCSNRLNEKENNGNSMWKLEKHVLPSCCGTSLSWCWWPKRRQKPMSFTCYFLPLHLILFCAQKLAPPPAPAAATTPTTTPTNQPTNQPTFICSTRLCPCFFLRACSVKLLRLLTPMSMVGMLLDGCYLGWMVPTWRTSWWFRPIWKILVKLDHFPR